MLIVNGQKLDVKFLMDKCEVHFCSIYSLVIYLWFLNNQIFAILQMFITLYSSEKKSTKINKNLIFDTKNILNWFRLNSLESKPWKILIRDSWGEVWSQAYIKNKFNYKVEACDGALLLEISTDKKLTFKACVCCFSFFIKW